MWYDSPTRALHLTQLVHDLSKLHIKTPCKLITLDINLHVNIPISKILYKPKTLLDCCNVPATLSWQTVLITCYIQPKLFSSVKYILQRWQLFFFKIKMLSKHRIEINNMTFCKRYVVDIFLSFDSTKRTEDEITLWTKCILM